MASVTPVMSAISTSPGDADRPTGPRRWGLMFASIWLFYLLSPLSAAWDRNDLRGVIGIVATLLFAAVYLAVFVRMRWRRFGAPFRPPLRASQGVAIVLLEIGLAV